MNTLSAFALLIPSLCISHMSMQYPHPRNNGGLYAVWKQNEPQFPVHPQVCHGLSKDSSVNSANVFAAGDTIVIDLAGTASHSGGHCAFWYSTDDITFTKIIDVKDCTLNGGAQVTLPNTMPVACSTQCTFAWTWVPRVSGACEIYSNCADIRVTGTLGQTSSVTPVSINFKTQFEYQGAANGYGCKRVDETTHFTSIFGAITTHSVWTDDVVIASSVCYAYPSMAINLNNAIDTLGSCGTGSGDYRCDDGNCCNAYGYCGSSSVYCANPIADWRTTDCTGTSRVISTPSPVTSSVISSSSSGNGGLEGITLTNAAGSGAWWYKVTLSNIPSGTVISSVFMMGMGQSTWVTGQYTSWGDFYLFSDDIPSNGYTAPLSFKIVSTSGQEIVAYNVMSSVSAGYSAVLDGSAGFEMEQDDGDDDESGKHGKYPYTYANIVAVVCLSAACLMMCAIVGWKRRQMAKQPYASQANGDDDITLAQLAKNDGMKFVYPTELIADGNVETIEIDVEMDVNDKDAMMATA